MLQLTKINFGMVVSNIKNLKVTISNVSGSDLVLNAIVKCNGTVVFSGDTITTHNPTNESQSVLLDFNTLQTIEVHLRGLPVAYDEVDFIVRTRSGESLEAGTEYTVIVTDIDNNNQLAELRLRIVKDQLNSSKALCLYRSKDGWYVQG